MKILFLDIDGVLSIPPGYKIENDLLENLKQVISKTSAKIVLSSSWKKGGSIEDTKRFYRNHSHPELPDWLLNNLYDQIEYTLSSRGNDIKTWLDKHQEIDLEEYVILDDREDILPEQLYHFVQTNYEFGFCGDRVELCIRLLNGEYIQNEFALNIPLLIKWRTGDEMKLYQEQFIRSHPFKSLYMNER